MPTFVERPTKSGKVKIKATCRVWFNGKQRSKSKTFNTKDEAAAWATKTESGMKSDKHQTAIIQFKKQDQQHQYVTLNDTLTPSENAINNVRAGLGDKPLSLLSSKDIIDYLYQRYEYGASRDELQIEADVIYQSARLYDRNTDNRLTNRIQAAINIAHADGLI